MKCDYISLNQRSLIKLVNLYLGIYLSFRIGYLKAYNHIYSIYIFKTDRALAFSFDCLEGNLKTFIYRLGMHHSPEGRPSYNKITAIFFLSFLWAFLVNLILICSSQTCFPKDALALEFA